MKTTLHFIIEGEFFTEKVRQHFLDHRLTLAHEWFNSLKPKPKAEFRKAVLFGDAEFIGATMCDDPKCDQCKDDTPFRMVFKENLRYKKKLQEHKKFIKEHYIEIDGDTIATKKNVSDLVELDNKVKELRKQRSETNDEEVKDDYRIKSKIIEAEDHRDAQIETFYQEHGVSKKYDYEIGSSQWKKKLEVDGLLEVIKARSLGDKSVRELLKEAQELGEKEGDRYVRSRKELFAYHNTEIEIKKVVKPSKDKIKVGKFSIPKNILVDYVESVKAMRTSMIIGTSREDPLIGANALALRIKQHKRIFEILKIPYHGDDKSNKKSQELYDEVEKYIERKYPELTLDSVGKTLSRKFAKKRKK